VLKKFLQKIRKNKKWKELRNLLPFLVIFLLFLIVEGSYFFARNELSHRLPFGMKVAGVEFSLVEADKAIGEIEILAKNFSTQAIRFEHEGKTFDIFPDQIDLDFEVEKKVGVLKSQLVHFGEIKIPATFNETRLRKILLAEFPELEYSPTDAKVFLNEAGELEILEDKNGKKTDFEEIFATVKNNAESFTSETIPVISEDVPPKIFAEKLESFRDELVKIVSEKLILKETEYNRFEINLADRINWFDFKDNGKLRVFLKKDAIGGFVQKELNLLVGELPHDVTISKGLNGEIIFDGVAKSGRMVDAEELFERISAALESGEREVEIPFNILDAPVNVGSELCDLGIKELVGEAITDYTGSPANRQYNIRNAAEKLNGRIIQPDDEFSFVRELGPVTLNTGYRKELVIKEGDIIPEVGGGVCQVSTTFFRTALNAGLPITSQKPHSFKVSYYDPPGLDATVYPGSADLKFINDTGYPILVQTAVEGTQLRVNFFGTRDGRSVKLSGPFYPNGDPVTNLRKAGMSMFWIREIIPTNGEKISEKYNSAYKLMPLH